MEDGVWAGMAGVKLMKEGYDDIYTRKLYGDRTSLKRISWRLTLHKLFASGLMPFHTPC